MNNNPECVCNGDPAHATDALTAESAPHESHDSTATDQSRRLAAPLHSRLSPLLLSLSGSTKQCSLGSSSYFFSCSCCSYSPQLRPPRPSPKSHRAPCNAMPTNCPCTTERRAKQVTTRHATWKLVGTESEAARS